MFQVFFPTVYVFNIWALLIDNLFSNMSINLSILFLRLLNARFLNYYFYAVAERDQVLELDVFLGFHPVRSIIMTFLHF